MQSLPKTLVFGLFALGALTLSPTVDAAAKTAAPLPEPKRKSNRLGPAPASPKSKAKTRKSDPTPSPSQNTYTGPDRLQPPAAGKSFSASGQVESILTDHHGVVKNVKLKYKNRGQVYPACRGMKVADVPHLVVAYEQPRWVFLHVDNGCIKSIQTALPFSRYETWVVR